MSLGGVRGLDACWNREPRHPYDSETTVRHRIEKPNGLYPLAAERPNLDTKPRRPSWRYRGFFYGPRINQ